jgi:hypothetical protein
MTQINVVAASVAQTYGKTPNDMPFLPGHHPQSGDGSEQRLNAAVAPREPLCSAIRGC